MEDRRIAALEEEVRRLARAHRRRGRMLVALGLGCGALLLVAARSAPSVIRAERFELTDEAGGHLVLEVAGGQASIVADGSLVDPGMAEAPGEDAPEAQLVAEVPKPAGVRLSFPADQDLRGVMVDCPETEFRYLARIEEGVAWIPDVPGGEDCRAFLRGVGFPSRAMVRSGDDLDCRLGDHMMLLCEPAE